MAEIIATFSNYETNITSFVTIDDHGYYHVSLKDNDCGEFLPVVIIYKTKNQAVMEAQKIVS